MSEEEEVPKKKPEMEEAITFQHQPGRYSMVSRERAKRLETKEFKKNTEFDSDREAGDNDPHKRR